MFQLYIYFTFLYYLHLKAKVYKNNFECYLNDDESHYMSVVIAGKRYI